MLKQPSQQASVLIVEDEHRARERVERIVSEHADLCVFGQAADCEQARALLDVGQPDVMLVDIGLPDGSGIDLIREINLRGYDTEVMVLTVFRDEKHVLAAIEAGATGYLLKDGEPEYIAESILALLQGDSPISASIARHLLRRFTAKSEIHNENTSAITPKLTQREKEVLDYIAKGFNGPEIATMLSLSPHTIAAHVKQIYKKLAVKSRTEAVFEAVKLGLVKL